MSDLIRLDAVSRRFTLGGSEVAALDRVSLRVAEGEYLAVMGPSGSGKSTLMNLLGCLDSPSGGQYLFRGQDTATMDALALARLRCHHFGFIFQRYHLLPHLDAAANVEIPAVYAGTSRPDRQARARQLLGRLGLADRSHHTPGQLSGGQQQRVSIARALANGGEVILADEPTGALDSQSGKEVMAILKELHAQGHTIILVTHDMNVASHADRIITLKDGRIEQDSGPSQTAVLAPATAVAPQKIAPTKGAMGHDWDRYREAGRMAMHAMLAHRMRTFLTMLGIIIGIAAVVSVVALGQGARAKVIDQINAMGTNTIEIFPGKGWGDEKMASIQTLNKGDLDALLGQPYLAGASPEIGSSGQLRYRNKTNSGNVTGVGNDYFKVKGMTLVSGRLLEWQDIQQRAAVAVVDKKSITSLLGKEDPVGKVVLVGTLPVRIVGVVSQETGFGPPSQSVNIWLPYSAVMSRLISQHHFSQITIRVKDGVQPALAEQAVIELITKRHGVKDFFTFSSDSIIKSVEKTTATMTLMVSAIAVISLIVGGVGVMNIMLVSVTERTREIGIRKALGAKERTILAQFVVEAATTSALGGVLGIALGYAVSMAANKVLPMFMSDTTITVSPSFNSIVVAFGISVGIGVLFGYLPARRAARLNPIEALRYD